MQPTIALSDQSYGNARRRFPARQTQIMQIVSDRDVEENIANRIQSYLTHRDESGDLLYVTHQGLLRTPHWHRADTWHLYIDEPLDVTYHRIFRLEEHRHLLLGYFAVRPSKHQRYDILEAKDPARLDAVLVKMKDDEIYEHFADFVWRLRHNHWSLFVGHDQFAQFERGECNDLEVHGLLHPSLLEQFASVTLMGANIEESVMYKYFASEGCVFSDHTAISNSLLYQAHMNGSRLVVKYFMDRPWSKTLRDTKVEGLYRDDGDEKLTHGKLYMRLCEKEANQHSSVPPLWIANRDVRDHEFGLGRRLPNKPEGMDAYQSHSVCCIMSALWPPQAHRKFLQDFCGMTKREIARAFLAQTAYQSCGRGILRNPDSDGSFLLIVPDRDTAEAIAQYYPGCRVEKLQHEYELADRGPGRPPEYGSDVERDAARREQNRIRMRRVRKKSHYVMGINAHKDQSADQCRTQIAHDLKDWAEVAPDLKTTGAFARSNWLSTRDKIGQGSNLFVPTSDLMAELQSRQGVTRISKEANLLICPTIFRDAPRLPDALASMGISIEWPGRTKDCAVFCRGFFLDLEHGDMTAEDFAAVFPDLEFLAYSSWSHTQDDRHYRIGIPSTQYVRPDVHTLILHTIVERLELAGWADALADGKKHGVDVGKLHEAAMFYLPSSRPDCFLTHFHAGRRPLDPQQWVSLIPDDLLASPAPPVPAEVHCYNDAPVHRDCAVQWAIEYWHRRGCVKGKGRTQLWLLAKRLAEAGCDDAEMRSVLDEQAGYATNPKERRDEIEGLLRDHAVIAGRRAA